MLPLSRQVSKGLWPPSGSQESMHKEIINKQLLFLFLLNIFIAKNGLVINSLHNFQHKCSIMQDWIETRMLK